MQLSFSCENSVMKNWFTPFFGLLMLLVGTVALAQSTTPDRFVTGTHYDEFSQRQPTVTDDGNVEVAEVFAYSCPHCMNLEPAVSTWLKTKADYITFVRIPAAWGDRVSDIHAKAYYTAEVLGIEDDVHEAFFREFHERRNYLESEAKLQELFARFGVESEEFSGAFNSFEVHSKLQKSKDLLRRYSVSQTPLFIVNGKYQSRGEQAGNYGTWFEIVDELAAREAAASQ
jgi:thiol:disulfide interchange protein DsbA